MLMDYLHREHQRLQHVCKLFEVQCQNLDILGGFLHSPHTSIHSRRLAQFLGQNHLSVQQLLLQEFKHRINNQNPHN